MWLKLPHERERPCRLIKKSGVEGLVLLTGDRHLAGRSTRDGGAGSPSRDVTSSGLNRAARLGRAPEVNRRRVAMMNRGDNFGLVTIDWDHPDPRVSLRIRDVTGDTFLARKLDLSTLRRRAPGAAR
jgi:alkaline phosphatase D